MLVDELVEVKSHPQPGPDSAVEMLGWGEEEEEEEPEAPVEALDDLLPVVDVSDSVSWERLLQVEDVVDDPVEEVS